MSSCHSSRGGTQHAVHGACPTVPPASRLRVAVRSSCPWSRTEAAKAAEVADAAATAAAAVLAAAIEAATAASVPPGGPAASADVGAREGGSLRDSLKSESGAAPCERQPSRAELRSERLDLPRKVCGTRRMWGYVTTDVRAEVGSAW